MHYILLILLLVGVSSSFGANKHQLRDSSIYVSKGVMQRIQDELVVTFDLFVDRDLTSNESVVLEPMVCDTLGRKVALPKIHVNSRRQYIMLQRGLYDDVNMSNVLMRKNGTQQRLRYLESLPYAKWMKSASLIVNEESCGCGIPVTNDVAFTTNITTPYSLPMKLPPLSYVMPQEDDVKMRCESGSAFVLFKVNKTEVDPSYGDNQNELDKIINSIDVIQQDTATMVTNITIHGYASPEGAYKLNERLSKARTNSIKEYVDRLYDFPQGIFHTDNTAEDWEGFEALLKGSSYSYKGEILRIIHSDMSPDEKELKIRRGYPEFFKMLLDDWFIMLRHTDYTIEYEVCFFNTIEQIERIYETNPKNLCLNELFQLAYSYESGSEERSNILMKSVLIYPDDPTANLNAAFVALSRRDIVGAKRYLDLAIDCKERDLAMGVYCLLLEDFGNADYYLKRADQSGVVESKQYIKIYNDATRSR